jgi:hypothetical protein
MLAVDLEADSRFYEGGQVGHDARCDLSRKECRLSARRVATEVAGDYTSLNGPYGVAFSKSRRLDAQS